MAAGQGFKTFNTGDVLTAADTNGYLMQGVLVFADAAARTAAITSPQEGQTSYLKDTDVIQVYSGSAWVTKSGASPLTTKGDLYTYSTTDARIGVGANGTVLTADSAEATGLKWSTAASGGMTSIANGSLSGTTITLNSISADYVDLYLVLNNVSVSNNLAKLSVKIDGATSNYFYQGTNCQSGSTYTDAGAGKIQWSLDKQLTASNTAGSFYLYVRNYAAATTFKNFNFQGTFSDSSNGLTSIFGSGGLNNASSVESLEFTLDSVYTFDSGTYTLYGVK
jgi:hypothetical protein